MNKWVEISAGLILLLGAIIISFYSLDWGFWNFGTAAWEVLKGSIIWIIALLGFIFIILGINDLKN
ncbi:MAG: hypothetical protein ABH804_02440 [archaeon]